MPKCVFINLDAAVERRRLLEASWPAPAGWSLERFPAIRVEGPPEGRPAAAGCFLSHREVIGRNLEGDDPLFVVEDDAQFGPSTFPAIDALLDRARDWDLLLTDVNPLEIPLLTALARARARLAASSDLAVHDLRGQAWVGTTAYIVRGDAKLRLFGFLNGAIDRPIDLLLRRLCDDGNLRVGVTVPFLTTASPAAEGSQIAATPWQRPLALYRRLLWLDRDLAACEREAEALTAELDPASRIAGAVMGAIAAIR